MRRTVRPPFFLPAAQWLASLGREGIATFLLTSFATVATGGAGLFWLLFQVYRVARDTPSYASEPETCLVMGARLEAGRASEQYQQRLERVRSLGSSIRVLIVGGPLGQGPSEAAIGRQWLIQNGMSPKTIEIEEKSRNTLENIQAAKATLSQFSVNKILIVTSRYHLHRCGLIARGFGLDPILCAAEAELHLDRMYIFRLVHESFLIFWYLVGKHWAELTANHRMLSRIR